jgi:hypothetical protein
MVTTMDSLPTAVFYVIQLYLTRYAYRQFLSISNSDSFKEIRYLTLYYGLTFKYSQEYCFSSAFRQTILCKMKDKSRQLGLTLSNSEFVEGYGYSSYSNVNELQIDNAHQHDDFRDFQGINLLSLNVNHTIINCEGLVNGLTKLSLDDFSQLNDLSQLSTISSLSTVELCYCKSLSDISGLRNIKNLKMVVDCNELTGLSSLTQLTTLFLEGYNIEVEELKNLTNLESLTLIYCTKDLSQLSSISSLSTVELCYCDFLSDVSGLRNVKNLKMVVDHEQELTGLSSLTQLTTLCLEYYQIDGEELKNLTKLVTLTLSECNSFTDSSLKELVSVRNVTLSYCRRITDISTLGHCSWIAIRNCPIETLTGLGNVESIIIENCSKLKSLNGLGRNNRYLSISGQEIVNIPPLRSIHTISIIGDRETISMVPLRNAQRLYLKNVTIKDLAVSDALQVLVLIDCKGFTKLPKGLLSLPVIHLIRLYDLEDISNLGKNRQVFVADCYRIADISSLRNVKDVRIHNCRAVKNYSSLINVKRLAIWSGKKVNEEVKRLSEEREIILEETSFNYEDVFPHGFKGLEEFD